MPISEFKESKNILIKDLLRSLLLQNERAKHRERLGSANTNNKETLRVTVWRSKKDSTNSRTR